MGTWILKGGGVEGRGRSGLYVFIHNSLLSNFQKDFLNRIPAPPPWLLPKWPSVHSNILSFLQ